MENNFTVRNVLAHMTSVAWTTTGNFQPSLYKSGLNVANALYLKKSLKLCHCPGSKKLFHAQKIFCIQFVFPCVRDVHSDQNDNSNDCNDDDDDDDDDQNDNNNECNDNGGSWSSSQAGI